MAIVRWNPRHNGSDLTSFRTEMDRLFEDFMRPANGRDWTPFTPPVDVEENQNEYVFSLDLPGVAAKDVKVSASGDTLTIRGERRPAEKKDESLHRVERSYGTFERSFTLGTPIRPDHIQATYKDGVLEVRVPKSDEARSREIEVKVG